MSHTACRKLWSQQILTGFSTSNCSNFCVLKFISVALIMFRVIILFFIRKKPKHFRVVFYGDQPQAHLCSNQAV